MGKRGPKPLPTAVINIRGGPQHYHRKKEDLDLEPQPDPNIPPCPNHLDLKAKQEWIRMAKELDECGILTNLDMAVFASYCHSYSRWIEATNQVKTQGSVITTPKGYKQQNPTLTIANKAEEMMIKAAAHMGITPSSRSGVKRADKQPKEKSKERFFKS